MSNTGQPNLNTELLFSEDKAVRQFVEEVRKEHGVGRVCMTEKGGLLSFRYNESTGGLEVKQGREWKPITASAAPAPVTGSAPAPAAQNLMGFVESSNSGYFPYSITITGDIAVSGTVDGIDLSAITAADIANVAAGGIAATDVQAALNELDSEKASAADPTFSGVVSLADGTAGAPSLTNTGDTNTGLYFPAADQVGLSVNGAEGFRVEAPTVAGTPNIVGGYSGNTVPAGVHTATIGGGGANEAVNTVTGNYGTVSGGLANTAVTVGVVGGGNMNTAGQNYATIGGGDHNEVQGQYGTIAGGDHNLAQGHWSSIIGGAYNNALAAWSTVLGGFWNNIIAGADNATVGGHKASVNNATHDGTFLYADSTDAFFYSTAANEFAVRATGGFRFVTAGTVADGDFTPTKTVTIDAAGTIDVPGVYEVDGVQVVGNQQAHIADAKEDYVATDLDTEAEIITAINATNAKLNDLLAALETHGLLASS